MRQARDSDVSSGDADKPRVFRVGGNLLFAVFGTEPARTAGFYEAVFGWSLRGDPADPSSEDDTGHVIGHIRGDLPVIGEAGRGLGSATARGRTGG